MSCIFTDLGPNGMMVTCSRGSRAPQCQYCKARPAELRCDFPYTGKKAGQTCDGKLCRPCATAMVGEDDRHLCPPHQRLRDAEAEKSRAADDWLDSLSTSRPPANACTCIGPHYGDPTCVVHRVDRDALDGLFPDWDGVKAITWWGDRDVEPPVSQLAGELRARGDLSVPRDTQFEEKRRRIESHDFDGDICSRCGTQGMPDGTVDGTCAELLMAQTNMYGCRPCPVCRDDHRYPHRSGYILCDECGHEAKGVRVSPDDVDGLALDVWLDEPRVNLAGAVLDATKEIRERVLGPDKPRATPCSRRHHRCDGCGGCAVVARDYPLATDCRACDWSTCPTQAPRLRETEAKKQATIGEKVAHVRGATQDREHACHWPGCRRQCKPAFWGCSEHWYRLPQELRDKVWRAYRPGQEQTRTPSREYLDVMREVDAWIAELQASNVEPRRTSFDEASRRARARDAARRPAPVGQQFLAAVGDVAQDLEARHDPGDIDASDFEGYGDDPGAGYGND